MEKQKGRKKISITSFAVTYLIIAAVVSAVLIMSSYCVIQFRTISHEGAGLLNRFEETCKYMKGKESATSNEIENDFCVSARLTASAIRISNDTLEPAKYGNGWIIRKKGDAIDFPADFSSDITFSASDLPKDYSTKVIDDTDVSCAKIRGNYYYIEFEPAAAEEIIIEKGVNFQNALDNIADATGFDYISLVSDKKNDYTITAATRKYADFSKASELGLNDFLSTITDTDSDTDESHTTVSKLMNINRKSYVVFGTKEFDINYKPDDAAVMLVPLHDVILRAIAFTLSLLFLIVIMCLPLAIWLISIFRRLSGGYFTDEQLSRYSYEMVKRKVLAIRC